MHIIQKLKIANKVDLNYMNDIKIKLKCMKHVKKMITFKEKEIIWVFKSNVTIYVKQVI